MAMVCAMSAALSACPDGADTMRVLAATAFALAAAQRGGITLMKTATACATAMQTAHISVTAAAHAEYTEDDLIAGGGSECAMNKR